MATQGADKVPEQPRTGKNQTQAEAKTTASVRGSQEAEKAPSKRSRDILGAASIKLPPTRPTGQGGAIRSRESGAVKRKDTLKRVGSQLKAVPRDFTQGTAKPHRIKIGRTHLRVQGHKTRAKQIKANLLTDPGMYRNKARKRQWRHKQSRTADPISMIGT